LIPVELVRGKEIYVDTLRFRQSSTLLPPLP
jgi:hypothetical protein